MTKKKDREPLAKITIYAPNYQPFRLGGNVHAPMSCQVEALGPYPIGKGFEGFLVVSPFGKTYVAEKESGGLIGPSLDSVREDVESAELKVMKEQVQEAVRISKTAEPVSTEEFWERMRNRQR
jgi:hypothetical protein